MSTYRQICLSGEQRLKENEIAEWKLDAWLLAEYVFGISRAWYFAHREEEAPGWKERNYQELIAQRASHIPLQHLTHQAFFMGMEFYVDENVLIPRQDTEILVESALEVLKDGAEILDLCTGSGCILLSLLQEAKKRGFACRGTGADISRKALEVAGKNRDRYGISANLIESDLYKNIEGDFDILISNPPYIPTGEIEGLMEEVCGHDPILALDGREDGLYFYREIIGSAGEYLKPGGKIFLEIGCSQANDVTRLLEDAGFTEICVRKDLAGLDRVVSAWRKGSLKEQEEKHV